MKNLLWLCLSIFTITLLLSSCSSDPTVKYKELRIVMVDRLGEEPNKDAFANLTFADYHAGQNINFFPENVYIERLDAPYEEVQEFLSAGERGKSADISAKRSKEIATKIELEDYYFQKSDLLFIEQLQKVDEFFFNNFDSYQGTYYFNKNYWLTDTNILNYDDGTGYTVYKDPNIVFNTIEEALQNRINEGLDPKAASFLIILMPEGQIVRDTVTIPLTSKFQFIAATCLREDLSFLATIGPFEGTDDLDSLVWEVIETSPGYTTDSLRGTTSESRIRVIFDSPENLMGYAKVRVTPYMKGMASQPEEIQYTFNVTLIQEGTPSARQSGIAMPAQAKPKAKAPPKEEPKKISQPKQQPQQQPQEQQKPPETKKTPPPEPKKPEPEPDLCPPQMTIDARNNGYKENIADFQEEVNNIWKSNDPILIEEYKKAAKSAISNIQGLQVDLNSVAIKLDNFLKDLGAKKYTTRPVIQPKYEPKCNLIIGISITAN
jgi:hypothetical protein